MDLNERNRHINEMLNNNPNPDMFGLWSLIYELMFSDCICLLDKRNQFVYLDDLTDPELSFLNGSGQKVSGINDELILPIFTDIDALSQTIDVFECEDDDFDLVRLDIIQFANLLENSSLTGFLLNLTMHDFLIPPQFMAQVVNKFLPIFTAEDSILFPVDGVELKGIYDSTNNDSLVNFIRTSFNGQNIDELLNEISKSFLSTIVYYEGEKIDVSEGVIGVNGFVNPITNDFGGIDCNIVFTNKDSLEITLEDIDNHNIYAQLLRFDVFVRYALEQGTDGIVLMDSNGAILLPRNELVNNFAKIYEMTKNPNLDNAVSFIFEK